MPTLQESLANVKPQIQVGDIIPPFEVKEKSVAEKSPLVLTGKNIVIGLPGAFTTPCNGHVPPFVESYDKFKAKGVENIYIIAVNDAFVTKAWKEKLAPEGSDIHFIADDTGEVISALGFLFDATGGLGGPRSKRFVLVTDGPKVVSIAVEEEVSETKVTNADAILASL